MSVYLMSELTLEFMHQIKTALHLTKPCFCIITMEPRYEENGFLPMRKKKYADQLRGNREADQRLCFRYTDSTIPFLYFSRY